MFLSLNFSIVSYKQEMRYKPLLQRTANENQINQNVPINLYLRLDKAFKGTVVNRTFPSLHEVEITLTVPLN